MKKLSHNRENKSKFGSINSNPDDTLQIHKGKDDSKFGTRGKSYNRSSQVKCSPAARTN